MKQKLIFTLFLCSFAITMTQDNNTVFLENLCDSVSCENHETEKTCNCPHCQQQAQQEKEQKLTDQQVGQLAVATLANMAQGILCIGFDPHNSQNVATSVTNIVGNFASFVVQAMKQKNVDFETLLNDEEFIQELTSLLIKKVEITKKKFKTTE